MVATKMRDRAFRCVITVDANEMGSPKNITDKNFVEAAEAADQSVEQAKDYTLKVLKKLQAQPKK